VCTSTVLYRQHRYEIIRHKDVKVSLDGFFLDVYLRTTKEMGNIEIYDNVMYSPSIETLDILKEIAYEVRREKSR
jgi:hypothetical protein